MTKKFKTPKTFHDTMDSYRIVTYLLEAGIYTATYLTVGGLIEYFNTKTKDYARWKLVQPQFMHSLPSIFIGGLFNNIFVHYIDPYGPYHGYYDRHDYSLFLFVVNCFFFYIVWETLFYWVHRLLHMQKPINLYRWIHKQHHYHSISTWAAFAVHPIELFAMTLLLHLPKYLVPIPFATHNGLMMITSILSSLAHDPDFDYFDHQIHHTKHVYNFGAYLPVWDWLCGTMYQVK